MLVMVAVKPQDCLHDVVVATNHQSGFRLLLYVYLYILTYA